MRRFLAGGLGLSLGLWTAGAQAQQTPSPLTAAPSPPITRPAASTAERPPLATLGRPVALTSSPFGQAKRQAFADQQVTPASYSAPRMGLPRPLVRAQNPESPQPLPAGPVIDAPAPGSAQRPSNSETTSEELPAPRLMPVPQKSGPPGMPPTVPHSVCSPTCDGDDCGVCCEDGPCRTCWGLFRRWGDVSPDAHCLWFRGEYLLWWMKESPLPPLVTTSPPGTPRELAGVLGAPGTAVLFDGDGNPERSGGRFTIGFWFDDEQTVGLESTTFFLGERSMTFRGESGGVPILARPFFNVLTGLEASELVAFPGVLAGNVTASSSNQLWGTELNLRTNCWRGCYWHLDWLNGVRFLGLDENLGITEGLSVPAGAGPLAGSSIIVEDRFGTHNLFVGGQTGLEVGFRCGRWSLDLLGKVALGNTHQDLNINGSTRFAVPGVPVSVQRGGLYALPSNTGHFSRDRFAVVPEAGAMVGFQLTPRVRAVVGYTFLYNSAVVRPGHQIDRGVNVSQLPSQIGPGTLVSTARPAPSFHGSDFWAQGLSFGLEIRY